MPKKKDEEQVCHAESLRVTNHTKILNDEGEFHVKCIPILPLVKRSPFTMSNQSNGTKRVLQEINRRVDLVSKAMFLAEKIGQVYLTMFCIEVLNESDRKA